MTLIRFIEANPTRDSDEGQLPESVVIRHREEPMEPAKIGQGSTRVLVIKQALAMAVGLPACRSSVAASNALSIRQSRPLSNADIDAMQLIDVIIAH